MSAVLKEVKLRFLEGENEGIEIRLEVPREVIIGRGEDCDIYLGEKKISRRHAKLVTSKNSLILEDNKSTNGTFVNGKRINHKETLANEDTIRIGTSVFQVDFIYEEAGGRGTSPVSERQISEPSQQNSIPSLVSSTDIPPANYSGSNQNFGNIDIEEKMIEIDEISDQSDVQPVKPVAKPKPSKSSLTQAPPPPPPMVEPIIEKEEASAAIEIDIDFSAEPSSPKPIIDPPKPVATPSKKPAPQATPQPTIDAKKKGLAGNLNTMPLHDLVQTLGNATRTGMLKLNGPMKGQVYVQEGKITHAFLEQAVTGEKALYRMLAWKEAEFELVPLPEKFSPPKSLGEALTSSTENLLIEGYRQLDELENLKKSLPPIDATLRINSTMDAPLSKLHPRVLDVLQLLIKHGSFAKVLDLSPVSDLDTAKMVFYLVKKGYIVSDDQ